MDTIISLLPVKLVIGQQGAGKYTGLQACYKPNSGGLWEYTAQIELYKVIQLLVSTRATSLLKVETDAKYNL